MWPLPIPADPASERPLTPGDRRLLAWSLAAGSLVLLGLALVLAFAPRA